MVRQWRELESAERNIARANELDPSIGGAKAQRPVGIDAVESASDDLVATGMDAQLRADHVRARKPCLGKEDRPALTPEPKHPLEAAGQQRSESLGRDPAAERRAFAARQRGGYGEIDSKTDDHPLAAPLEQDSCNLLAEEQQVIGPFEHERLARHCNVDRFDKGKARGERERLRLRIVLAKLDQRAAVEVAGRRDPAPVLPAFSSLLLARDKPVALACARV
jgi:hypothetical protein